MFLRYHGDVEATQAAYDENGYYKTGDIGRREGPYFFISGRASIDSKLDFRSFDIARINPFSNQIRRLQDLCVRHRA